MVFRRGTSEAPIKCSRPRFAEAVGMVRGFHVGKIAEAGSKGLTVDCRVGDSC